MRHIPNILTVLRILVTPVILNRIWERDLDTALILFFLSGISDGFDGWLARKYNWTSKFGAFIDPIADKTLVMSTFLTLGMRDFIPFWLVYVVIGRDILILLAALVLKFTGQLQEFPPTLLGKISTTLQLLTAGSILLRWPADPAPFFYATALLAVLSLADYANQIRRELGEK